jgi:hypothetical protein
VAVSPYLVDKSAFEQQRHSTAADELLKMLAAEGRLAVCETGQRTRWIIPRGTGHGRGS